MTWQREVAAALGAEVVDRARVTGGDINDAYRVRLSDGRDAFVKTHAAAPAGMFAAEAEGLAWLGAGPLRVPEVLAVGDAWLALTWLPVSGAGTAVAPALGRGLAALHRLGAPSFGGGRDNFLATLPQRNAPMADWPRFYVERRLRPLVERGVALGRIPDVRRALDALPADRFGPAEPPARLHGDLWWGNVVAVDDAPVILDPAAYGGHREIDLAMLALFGALPASLIAAYEEVWPLAEGWRDRLALHQLYPLAAHAVLFGGSYGGTFASTLARYA